MPAWLTDFRELWIIVGVAALLEAIAIWQGKRARRPTIVVYTISSRMWLAIARYRHFSPLFFSACVVLAVHFWIPPTVPRTWTTPEGWAYIVVGVIVVWTIHIRRIAMSQGIGVAQKLREEPVITTFLGGTGAAGIVVLLLKQFAGVEVSAEVVASVFLFIGAIVTAWQRRSVTSTAKIERLEDRGLIGAMPASDPTSGRAAAPAPPTIMEVIKDPPKVAGPPV